MAARIESRLARNSRPCSAAVRLPTSRSPVVTGGGRLGFYPVGVDDKVIGEQVALA
jgi:hypothetical protein